MFRPASVDDWSWIWSKLYGVRNEIGSIRVVDGAPRRTVPYIQACGIKDADYDLEITGGHFQFILTWESVNGLNWKGRPTWKEVQDLKAETVMLEANLHLENGLKLADWLPDLVCYYHYPLFISDEDRQGGREKTVRAILGDRYSQPHPMSEGPVVGVSCASYKGSNAWDTWGRTEWVDFLHRVMSLGWRPLLVGGSWDDLTYSVACELDLPSTVGKTSVFEMIEQMNILDAYIGFSSGMNVIRTVLDRPAMALWPQNQKCDQGELSTSWAPPLMLQSGRYVAVAWRPVDDIFPVAKRFLRRCEVEVQDRINLMDPTLSEMLKEGYYADGTDGKGHKDAHSRDAKAAKAE